LCMNYLMIYTTGKWFCKQILLHKIGTPQLTVNRHNSYHWFHYDSTSLMLSTRGVWS
jgi:hypothetical protein